MIRDLDTDPPASSPAYDLVVVGSGPAGMTVASELADSGLRIAVLESGKRRTTPHADALKRVSSRGIVVKEWSRERVLGGASTTWAGLSSPLDPIDFEARPYMRSSGWPIARDELVPYWARAARYRFPEPRMFGALGFAAMREKGSLRPAWRSLEEKVFLACADPQDFGSEHAAIFAREGVDLWLGASITEIERDPAASGKARASSVVARDRGGREVRFTARAIVIATGGIENARLLLLSRSFGPRGLGNDHDQVGRHMMNHPKNYYGIVALAKPVDSLPYWFGCLHQDYAGYGGIRLREDEQRARGVLNSYVRMEPLFPWSDSRGVEALVLLVKRSAFFFKSWKAKRRGEVVELRDYSETGDDSDLQNERKDVLAWVGLGFTILFDLKRVLHYLWYRVIARSKPRIERVRLRNFMEMEPDPENRVVLGDERDAYDRPLPHVSHAPTALDRRSLVLLHAELKSEFEALGVGRLDGDLDKEARWPIDQDASHHMGTTRMGVDPRTSVVDRDAKVHDVANVYLAGGSVFPTSGCANPTFTIVALAIRLAEHLRRDVFELGSEESR